MEGPCSTELCLPEGSTALKRAGPSSAGQHGSVVSQGLINVWVVKEKERKLDYETTATLTARCFQAISTLTCYE